MKFHCKLVRPVSVTTVTEEAEFDFEHDNMDKAREWVRGHVLAHKANDLIVPWTEKTDTDTGGGTTVVITEVTND